VQGTALSIGALLCKDLKADGTVPYLEAVAGMTDTVCALVGMQNLAYGGTMDQQIWDGDLTLEEAWTPAMQAWYRMFEEGILDSSAAGLTGDVVPGWDDEVITLMLEAGSESLLAVWSRGEAAEVALPEIAGEHHTGRRIEWGGRQEVDYTHAAFKFHAERVIRKIMARYADHPAVIGFQVDNEPGLRIFHNEGVFQQFVDRLRHQYGGVETLNREWGLVYWSHRLTTWADLWRPDGNAQPQYTLAWRKFQADLTTEFIGWQAGITSEYASEDQFVTTCI
jgi:hypothetical protein